MSIVQIYYFASFKFLIIITTFIFIIFIILTIIVLFTLILFLFIIVFLILFVIFLDIFLIQFYFFQASLIQIYVTYILNNLLQDIYIFFHLYLML